MMTNRSGIRSNQEGPPRYTIKKDVSWVWVWASESKLSPLLDQSPELGSFSETHESRGFEFQKTGVCQSRASPTKPKAAVTSSEKHRALLSGLSATTDRSWKIINEVFADFVL